VGAIVDELALDGFAEICSVGEAVGKIVDELEQEGVTVAGSV